MLQWLRAQLAIFAHSLYVCWHLNDIQNPPSFHSKPLVTPKGGRPVLCLKMGSLSISTVVEKLKLGTHVMKDEEKPRLCVQDGQSCEQFTTRRNEKCVDDVCEWLSKISAVGLSDIQHYKYLHMSPSKDLGMLHHCRAIANACVKQRVGHSRCSHSPPCLSPMLVVPVRERVTVLSWKQEQTVPYAHDNHNLHIKCFLCGAFLKSLLQFFVQLYSFSCEWETIVWEPMMMLFNLSKCCKWFTFRRTWSAV